MDTAITAVEIILDMDLEEDMVTSMAEDMEDGIRTGIDRTMHLVTVMARTVDMVLFTMAPVTVRAMVLATTATAVSAFPVPQHQAIVDSFVWKSILYSSNPSKLYFLTVIETKLSILKVCLYKFKKGKRWSSLSAVPSGLVLASLAFHNWPMLDWLI